MDILETTKIAMNAALAKKAEKVVLQDLRGISDICSYQVICSGNNERQTQAISMNIQQYLKQKYQVNPIAIEGRQTGHWILMDYGGIIIHVFKSSIRDYYALDSLWPEAKCYTSDEIGKL